VLSEAKAIWSTMFYTCTHPAPGSPHKVMHSPSIIKNGELWNNIMSQFLSRMYLCPVFMCCYIIVLDGAKVCFQKPKIFHWIIG